MLCAIHLLYEELHAHEQGPEARSNERPPGMRMVVGSILRSGNILLLRFVMKSFLRPFSSYCWFK